MTAAHDLAGRLARCRQTLATSTGALPRDELGPTERDESAHEAQRYLDAAAGIAVAAVAADSISVPPRVTAAIRDTSGQTIARDTYASHLQARADLGRQARRLPILSEDEAQAIAELLDELAVRIYDRLGL